MREHWHIYVHLEQDARALADFVAVKASFNYSFGHLSPKAFISQSTEPPVRLSVSWAMLEYQKVNAHWLN